MFVFLFVPVCLYACVPVYLRVGHCVSLCVCVCVDALAYLRACLTECCVCLCVFAIASL